MIDVEVIQAFCVKYAKRLLHFQSKSCIILPITVFLVSKHRFSENAYYKEEHFK